VWPAERRHRAFSKSDRCIDVGRASAGAPLIGPRPCSKSLASPPGTSLRGNAGVPRRPPAPRTVISRKIPGQTALRHLLLPDLRLFVSSAPSTAAQIRLSVSAAAVSFHRPKKDHDPPCRPQSEINPITRTPINSQFSSAAPSPTRLHIGSVCHRAETSDRNRHHRHRRRLRIKIIEPPPECAFVAALRNVFFNPDQLVSYMLPNSKMASINCTMSRATYPIPSSAIRA